MAPHYHYGMPVEQLICGDSSDELNLEDWESFVYQ